MTKLVLVSFTKCYFNPTLYLLWFELVLIFLFFSFPLVFSCVSIAKGATTFFLWWQFHHFLCLFIIRVLCLFFLSPLRMLFCCPLYWCLVPPLCIFCLWVFRFLIADISILIVLQLTKMFRSILNIGVIHCSNCNTFHVVLWCERCLDISCLQARSKATAR